MNTITNVQCNPSAFLVCMASSFPFFIRTCFIYQAELVVISMVLHWPTSSLMFLIHLFLIICGCVLYTTERSKLKPVYDLEMKQLYCRVFSFDYKKILIVNSWKYYFVNHSEDWKPYWKRTASFPFLCFFVCRKECDIF